jgi:tetratricopeptide (TPR) repeat protein
LAAAPILNEVEFGSGVSHAAQQLMEARKRDPKAQLWPEISMSIIGQDFMREGELKSAVEVLKLNLLAYSDSADANETLAEAYLRDGQKELARRHAEKALSILDSHTMPASSWSDTEQQRGEIRKGAGNIKTARHACCGSLAAACRHRVPRLPGLPRDDRHHSRQFHGGVVALAVMPRHCASLLGSWMRLMTITRLVPR